MDNFAPKWPRIQKSIICCVNYYGVNCLNLGLKGRFGRLKSLTRVQGANYHKNLVGNFKNIKTF